MDGATPAGPRRDWDERPGLLGPLHHELRFLHRDQPRWNADIGDPAPRPCGVAKVHHAGRGSDHGAGPVLRDGEHPARPRPPGSFAERHLPRELPLPASVGCRLGLVLLDRKHRLLVPTTHPGRSDPPGSARPPKGLLPHPGLGLDRDPPPEASSRKGDFRNGRPCDPRCCQRPYRRELGLRHDRPTHVALDDLRPLLRGRSDLFGHRRHHHRHGGHPEGLPP